MWFWAQVAGWQPALRQFRRTDFQSVLLPGSSRRTGSRPTNATTVLVRDCVILNEFPKTRRRTQSPRRLRRASMFAFTIGLWYVHIRFSHGELIKPSLGNNVARKSRNWEPAREAGTEHRQEKPESRRAPGPIAARRVPLKSGLKATSLPNALSKGVSARGSCAQLFAPSSHQSQRPSDLP